MASAVVRLSLALALLHLVLLIAMLTRDAFAKTVNEHGLVLKYMVVVAFFFALFYVPNRYLQPLASFSNILGAIFLLYQSVALIDFAYAWNELWTEKYDGGTSFYGVLLVAGTLIGFAGWIWVLRFGVGSYWVGGCFYNKLVLIVLALLPLVYVVLVVLKLNPGSSVLTAAVIALLTIYQGLNALDSQPSICNPRMHLRPGLNVYLRVVIDLVLFFAAILRLSLSSIASQGFRANNLQYNIAAVPAEETGDNDIAPRASAEALNTRHGEKDGLEVYRTNSFVVFHALMAVFGLCLIPFFFNWHTWNLDEGLTATADPNKTAFVVKTLNAAAIPLLYIWTLVCPALFPHREY